MDARLETPENLNFLSPLLFKFQIKKTPTVNWFVQSVNIPGLSLSPVDMHNPFVKQPHPGDHIDYDDIMINFKVDEDLVNYLEIHNWIKAMGYPDRFEQYKEIKSKPRITGLGIRSDISLIILTNNKNPKFEVTFKDAFPVSISSLIFDMTRGDIEYLEAAATFKYVSYDITPL